MNNGITEINSEDLEKKLLEVMSNKGYADIVQTFSTVNKYFLWVS